MVARAYEVDASSMCDVLRSVPGVDDVSLEFDSRGNGVLRVRLRPEVDEDDVVGAAVAQLHRRFGVGLEGGRLRLTGPSGRTVVAVVEPHRRGVPSSGTGPRPVAAAITPPDASPSPTVAGRDDAPGPVHVTQHADVPQHADVTQQAEMPQRADVPDLPDVDLDTAAPDHATARLVLDRVEVATGRLELWATVRLLVDDVVHTGTASATATGSGANRAVVAAAARAAESALGGKVRLDVEAVDVLGVGSDQVGVVVVTLLTERGVDRVSGAALVRGDGRETLVRATLDALNRRTESLQQGRLSPPS